MSFEDLVDDHAFISELPTREALATHTMSPAVRSAGLPSSSSTIPSSSGEDHQSSLASRVDVEFFDPEGVRSLSRTLSKISTGRDAQSDSMVLNDILIPEGPFDLEKTLRTILKRQDEADILSRELGVMFQNLRVVGLGAQASYQDTLGSLLNPLVAIEQLQTLRHPPLRDILSGFEGVIRPGEMLLVLGRPGSGCTTLLKTIANQREEYHSVEGDVYYDSLTPQEIAKHYRGDVQYCPEDDVHFPMLTVEQTIQFAAKMRAPSARFQKTRTEYVNMMTEILTTIFGLKHVRNTPVGDATIRGVSGGEKKRVSIAEALATRSRVTSWDNSTRGLDASTALEFGRALRIATDVFHTTTIVSIYQAGENLYELFDKVCVVYEGRMVYFGPADRARQYFIDMGYEPAYRQTTPDFLVAVTDPNGRIPREGVSAMPRTAAEFAEYFNQSPIAQLNRDDMARYKEVFVGHAALAEQFRKSALAEHAKHTRNTSPYMISIPMQTRAVMKRRVQILLGDKLATVFNFGSFVWQGIILGTVFLKSPKTTSAFFSRGGLLFFSLLFPALSSLAEIAALYGQRPIVARHKKAAMYHPFIESLAMTLVGIPMYIGILLVYSTLVYSIAQLQQTAGQFFVFFLFLSIISLTMQAWFRAVAAAFKSEATAQSVAGILLLAMVIYTGYTIPKTEMIGALRWISYINAPRWGFESLVANEFHTLNGTCSALVPSGPGYETVSLANQVCAMVGAVPGQDFVDGNAFIRLSFGYSYSHLWMNFGILMGFFIAFVAALLIFSEYNTTTSSDTFRVIFKRGAKSPIIAELKPATDEEKSPGAPTLVGDSESQETKKALVEQPTMSDIFSWQHLNYTVHVSDGPRVLLNDVSGYVAPGKLTALMGESGAGKTTLLNALAQRIYTGVVMGDRFVNGHVPPADFQSQTGYCQQQDTHVPTDTVREALLFSAMVRQPESVPIAEKEAYVETCLKMCGLTAFADAAVGSLGVEQRKRTTIAVELVAKPKLLLFLDEPTSGLDSQSAWAIMAFLRDLADHGQAILCTIHQPSAELFQVFDRLLLLRKGGQTVYFGDLGHNASTLIHYFEKNGSRRCGPNENPAEFMLDVIGAGATASTNVDWHAIWKSSKEAAHLQRELSEIHARGRHFPAIRSTLHGEFATSWFNQLRQLLYREARTDWRRPTYLMAKLVLNIFGGLFIGFTFFKADNSQQGVQDKLFSVYMATVLAAPLTNQLQVPFIQTRNIYEIRERPSRMYSWTALLTSQYLAETPWNIIGSTLLYLCWFWTVGYPSSRAAYTFLVYSVMYPMYYTSFALAVAAMVPTAELAALLFSVLFSFAFTFNGVLQPFPQLGWWKWMYWVSPFTYIIEGLYGQAVGRQSVVCAAREFVTLIPPSGQTCGAYLQEFINTAGGYVQDPFSTSSCQFCSFATTDHLLAVRFHIFYSHRWRNVGIMIAYTFVNIALLFILTYMFRIRTGSLLGSLKRRFSGKRSCG